MPNTDYIKETERLVYNIENQIGALHRATRDGKVPIDALQAATDALLRCKKMLSNLIDTAYKPIKEVLEHNDSCIISNRKYYYKTTTAYVFDANKAKATLESLEYSLADFNKPQTRKELTWEINT